MHGVPMRVRALDQLDRHALGAVKVERAGSLPFPHADDGDTRCLQRGSGLRQIPDAQGHMVDAFPRRFSRLRAQAKDLVAEQQEDMVRSLPDYVEPQSVDEKRPGFRKVPESQVHVVKTLHSEPDGFGGHLLGSVPGGLMPTALRRSDA